MFEDDGSIASGTTSVAYDADRKLLFLSGKRIFSLSDQMLISLFAGLSSPQLAVCKL